MTIPFRERMLCTVAEAVQACGLGKTKLYELMRGGHIETIKIDRRRLIRVASLLEFIGE